MAESTPVSAFDPTPYTDVSTPLGLPGEPPPKGSPAPQEGRWVSRFLRPLALDVEIGAWLDSRVVSWGPVLGLDLGYRYSLEALLNRSAMRLFLGYQWEGPAIQGEDAARGANRHVVTAGFDFLLPLADKLFLDPRSGVRIPIDGGVGAGLGLAICYGEAPFACLGADYVSDIGQRDRDPEVMVGVRLDLLNFFREEEELPRPNSLKVGPTAERADPDDPLRIPEDPNIDDTLDRVTEGSVEMSQIEGFSKAINEYYAGVKTLSQSIELVLEGLAGPTEVTSTQDTYGTMVNLLASLDRILSLAQSADADYRLMKEQVGLLIVSFCGDIDYLADCQRKDLIKPYLEREATAEAEKDKMWQKAYEVFRRSYPFYRSLRIKYASSVAPYHFLGQEARYIQDDRRGAEGRSRDVGARLTQLASLARGHLGKKSPTKREIQVFKIHAKSQLEEIIKSYKEVADQVVISPRSFIHGLTREAIATSGPSDFSTAPHVEADQALDQTLHNLGAIESNLKVLRGRLKENKVVPAIFKRYPELRSELFSTLPGDLEW